jgi:SAM-dependent methyltransferase
VVRLTTLDETVLWHDVECASYTADLPLWRGLAAERPGALLDLGSGSGRVALDLAACGCDVTGLDSDPALVNALAARAREQSLRVRTGVADARSFSLGRTFALVIAPMQVVQLLGGPGGREAALRCIRAHLDPGGVFAAALADPFEAIPDDAEPLPPLPDVREEGGWVFSSAPVAVRPEGDGTAIDRLRQAVSPQGGLTESMSTIVLDRVEPARLEAEASALGFRALARRAVPETDGYVGSTVVVLEAI